MEVKKQWGKFRRIAAVGTLSLTLLLGSAFPVLAETSAPVAAPAPTISQWSLPTLNEGEKYGIYPINWYYDGTFLKPITGDNFNSLMAATAKKLDLLGFKKKSESVTSSTYNAITRETVVTSLHKLLTNYELPEAFGKTAEGTAVNYMQQQGIVQGTKAGLELANPCTAEQAVVLASRLIAFAYDKADKGAKGLMWKVTNEKNTLYLLGSVHLGITEMYPMHESIQQAFQASDDLWVEANMVTGDMSLLIDKMLYTDGNTLKKSVTASTYEKLQKVLVKLKLPAETFDGLKPFAVSSSLTSLSIFENATDLQTAQLTGIDNYFIVKALLTGKPIQELEGIKFQADLLGDVPADQQEKELNELLDSILSETEVKEAGQKLKDMQLAWVKGDKEAVEKWITDSESSVNGDVNDRLLGDRDKKMAIKLAELLEQEGKNTSFVVVGAAHYVTKGMVVDLLKEKGYTVEAMQ